jgi:hypothetical protein
MLRMILVVVVGLLALPAGVIAADVRVDYNRHHDFARHKSFQVEIGALVRSDGVLDVQNTLAEDRLRQTIGRALERRGLSPAEAGADLVVHVSGRETGRTAIMSSGFGYGGIGWGRYGYLHGYHYWWPDGHWGGSPFYDDIWTRQYLEGSLTVDVIDRESGRLVYRAQVVDEVGRNLDKHVTRMIDRAFKEFPVKQLR